MKKALMFASVASMIKQFNMSNIDILKEAGYKVDVAANFEYGSTLPQDKVDAAKEELRSGGVEVYNIDVPRKITAVSSIIKAYKDTKCLCHEKRYDIIHCHSPIGGVICRLAARKLRKNGTKVIYTAHGFHFFKGAPLKNWLIYLPFEWLCSFLTDILITINTEDFEFAKKHLHAKQTEYVHGVGIDTEKLKNIEVDREKKREELGIPKESFAVLSVGELNDNKNHETILRAIAKIDRKDIVYVICGQGNKKEYLENLAKELGLEERLILAGFRKDVVEIYKCCDLFAFPSKREGLPVSVMEAMASGLPCVVSDIRGCRDLIKSGKNGFLCNPMDIDAFAKKLNELHEYSINRKNMGVCSQGIIKEFSLDKVKVEMEKVYIKK